MSLGQKNEIPSGDTLIPSGARVPFDRSNEMKQIEQTENNMGTAKIPGLVLKTGVPLMVSLLINSLYNFVDSVFVSRVSEDALAALSLAAPVQILMSAMGLWIAVGLNAVISKALGGQDVSRDILSTAAGTGKFQFILR